MTKQPKTSNFIEFNSNFKPKKLYESPNKTNNIHQPHTKNQQVFMGTLQIKQQIKMFKQKTKSI